MDKLIEEYTSDEGNYSSLSSTSLISGPDDYLNDHRTSFSEQNTSSGNFNLTYHKTFEKLVRKNASLERELESSWKQVQHALSERPNNESDMEKKMLAIQQENFHLHFINKSMREKSEKLQQESEELQEENKSLNEKLIEQLRVTDCKVVCISQLKDKVGKQQEEILNSIQKSSKQSKEINDLQSEVEYLSKSLNWYKNQWKTNLEESACLFKELLKVKSILETKVSNIKALKSSLQTNINQNDKFVPKNVSEPPNHFDCIENLICKYLQEEIQWLNTQMENIKQTVNIQNDFITKLNQEKGDLLEQNNSLQNDVINYQKDIQLSQKSNEKHANMEKIIQTQNIQLIEHELNLIQCKTQLKYYKKHEEKVRNNLQTVCKDFQKFKTLYKCALKEITSKNQQLKMLQQENHDFLSKTSDLCQQLSSCKKSLEQGTNVENNKKLNENIQKLQVMIKVKNLNLDTLQRRYERYNRVLLKQLKDKKKIQKKIERKNAILTTRLHSTLEDIKMQISEIDEKDKEIKRLKNELRAKNQRHILLEENITKLHEECKEQTQKLHEKSLGFDHLQKEFDNLLETTNKLRETHDSNKKIIPLEANLLDSSTTIEKSEDDLDPKNNTHDEKNDFVIHSENEILMRDLLKKSEQNNFILSEKYASATSENSFLQRLLCDVKMALNDSVRHNKVLTMRNSQVKENILDKFPDPAPITDISILKQIMKPSEISTSPLVDLKSSINALKIEMANLQEQLYSN